MEDWRSRAWYQISALERALADLGAGPDDVELARRRDVWTAIDRVSWPQQKEAQFAQLERATRIEVDLLRYLPGVPPMRDLIVSSAAPDLPPVPGDLRDWRARALYQVHAFAGLLGGIGDPEARRRALLWLAIERFAWPQYREPLFAQLEQATHALGGLVHYLCQSQAAREIIFRPREAAAAARPAPPAPEPAADPAADPLGGILAEPAAEPGPYAGPPAEILQRDAEATWKTYVESARDKPRAVEAARKLKTIFDLLRKCPEGGKALDELEKAFGVTLAQALDDELERRLG